MDTFIQDCSAWFTTIAFGGTGIDWQNGDEIVLATTSMSNTETESARIVHISIDRRTLTLDRNVAHTHVVYNETYGSQKFVTGAEVAVIFSNILIRPKYHSPMTVHGHRVLVSARRWETSKSVGHRISGVLFHNLGSFGGHPSLELKGVERLSDKSYIMNCMFVNSKQTALFTRESDGILIKDNVIYMASGLGMNLGGNDQMVIHNLILQTKCQTPIAPSNLENNPAAVDITETRRIIWDDNAIAGSFCVGLKTRGSSCARTVKKTKSNSVVHSCPLGVLIIEPRSTCVSIQNIMVYSTSSVAIFWSSSSAIQVDNLQLVDNVIGFYPVIEQVRADSRDTNVVRIRQSLIVGHSGKQHCQNEGNVEQLGPLPTSLSITGHVGLVISQFLYPFRLKINFVWKINEAHWENMTFANFGDWCPNQTDILMTSDVTYRSTIQTALFKNTVRVNVSEKHIIRYLLPNHNDELNFCGELECDSWKNVLVIDQDGGLFDRPTTILPKPKRSVDSMLFLQQHLSTRRIIRENGTIFDPSKQWPFHGIVQDKHCNANQTKQANICKSTMMHRLLLIQPLSRNRQQLKRLGPASLTTNHHEPGFIDVINGLFGCSTSDCKTGRDIFPCIVVSGLTFSLHFLHDNPDRLHLRFSDASDNFRLHLRIDYRQAARYDVYVDDKYHPPQIGHPQQDQIIVRTANKNAEFIPNVNMHPVGTNFYDSDSQLLHVILGGASSVEIAVTSYLKMTLTVDANVILNKFYMTNLKINLANYLGLLEHQVVVSRVNAPKSGIRRRRMARSLKFTNQLDVQVADAPGVSVNESLDTGRLYDIKRRLDEAVSVNLLDHVLNTSILNVTTGLFLSDFDRNQQMEHAQPTYSIKENPSEFHMVLSYETDTYIGVPTILNITIENQNNQAENMDDWTIDVIRDRGELLVTSDDKSSLILIPTKTGLILFGLLAYSERWNTEVKKGENISSKSTSIFIITSVHSPDVSSYVRNTIEPSSHLIFTGDVRYQHSGQFVEPINRYLGVEVTTFVCMNGIRFNEQVTYLSNSSFDFHHTMPLNSGVGVVYFRAQLYTKNMKHILSSGYTRYVYHVTDGEPLSKHVLFAHRLSFVVPYTNGSFAAQKLMEEKVLEKMNVDYPEVLFCGLQTVYENSRTIIQVDTFHENVIKLDQMLASFMTSLDYGTFKVEVQGSEYVATNDDVQLYNMFDQTTDRPFVNKELNLPQTASSSLSILQPSNPTKPTKRIVTTTRAAAGTTATPTPTRGSTQWLTDQTKSTAIETCTTKTKVTDSTTRMRLNAGLTLVTVYALLNCI